MLDMNVLVGKTIERIVHNTGRYHHDNESVTVFCTDGTSYIFSSNGGEDWSTINLIPSYE